MSFTENFGTINTKILNLLGDEVSVISPDDVEPTLLKGELIFTTDDREILDRYDEDVVTFETDIQHRDSFVKGTYLTFAGEDYRYVDTHFIDTGNIIIILTAVI